MSENMFLRTEMLIGKEAIEKLKNSKVALFGVGGVGSYVCEALVRSNVGSIDLFDGDIVDVTNINRQVIADTTNIGQVKVEVAKKRILNINPNIKVEANYCFFSQENADTYDFSNYDYVIDAIDTISSKILIIQKSIAAGIPVISSMGTGNKLNPTDFAVSDIYKTSYCPLAKVMRKELKKRGIKKLKVVYSKEKPLYKPINHKNNSKPINASISFVPSVAGFIIASEVIKDIISKKR